MSKKKLIRDTLIYTFLPKISFIASILILPFITPYLSLLDYGLHGIVTAYISVFQIVIILGQNIVLQNAYFEYSGRRYAAIWRRCFGIMCIAGVVSAAIFVFILSLILKEELGNLLKWVGLMVSVFLILSPFETMAGSYFVLKEKSVQYAYGSAISGIITTGITFVSIRYFNAGFMGWILALPISILIKLVCYFKALFIDEKLFPVFLLKKRFVLKALRVGVPLAPHQLSLYILGASDRLLLQYFKVPYAEIGLYSQGYNLGSHSTIVISGVFQALSKKLQEGFRGNGDYHRIYIRKLMFLVTIGLSAFLFLASLWVKEIFLFLFRNPQLQKAYPVTVIVLCSYMFWSIYTFFTYPLSINNKTFSISKITLLAAVFNVIANIILIPFFGIWAALGATYFSYLIFGLAGLSNEENRNFLNRFVNLRKLCFCLLFLNVTFFAIAYFGMDILPVYKAGVTIIIFISLLYMFKKLFPELKLVVPFKLGLLNL